MADGGPLRIGPYLVHTILILAPAMLFPAALALDIAYVAAPDAAVARAAEWCLGIGLAFALAAGTVGGMDYATHASISQHRMTGPHVALAMTLLTLEAANFLARYSYGSETIVSTGLALSIVSVALMTGLIVLGRRVVRDAGRR